jgi:hypothetical protein
MLPPDLVAKLNECAKTNFIGERDVWFFWQSIFSWFVILGLVLEGPELLFEMFSIVRSRIQRFRDSIVLIEKHLELAKALAFVGWIFIIGGLFGELRASSRIADLSASIQECSDAKVKEATLEAGDAADSAKTARAEADAAKKSSDKALAISDTANERAGNALANSSAAVGLSGKAQTKADNVANQADDLLKKYVEAENKVEQERNVRIELEKSLMPRRLFQIGYADRTSNLDVLKPLAGTEFIVESIPDFEARRAASGIVSILEWANLKVVHTGITEDFVWDGVTVDPYSAPDTRNQDQQTVDAWKEMHSTKCAEIMEAFLWANGWKRVVTGLSQHGELKPNVLRIRVGFKPAPFFDILPFARSDDIEAELFSQYATPIDKITKKINSEAQAGGNPFPRPDK